MPRPSLAAALVLPLTLAPALAQTPAPPLSDEDRTALRAEIRAYLLDNPEVIFEAVAEYERRTAAAQAEMDAALVEVNAEALFADGHSWVGGNPDGDLTLVEFMDYRCGFCRRAFGPMMDFVRRDANVRLVIKELPILGPQSEVMSRFAVAVHQLGGDAAYAAVHERLLAIQGDVNDTILQAMAVELGLDGAAVIARMAAPEVSAVLDENRLLAQRMQISGTPSFVIGDGRRGRMLRGLVPPAELAAAAEALRG